MKVNQINTYGHLHQTNFKSTYPVVHRIYVNGNYIPVSDFKEFKKMQGKLIRALNMSFEKMLSKLDKAAQQNVLKWTSIASLDSVKSELKLPKTEQEAYAIFRGRFGFYDTDYAYAPKKLPKKEKNNTKIKNQTPANQNIRTFYNREKGLLDGRYYLAYMISGKDIAPFEEDLAKVIGKEKHKSLSVTDTAYSQDVKDAIDRYNKNGLDFVNNPQNRLKSKTTGMTYILRANFEPIKNKAGKIKDYKFISAKFVPEYSQSVK